MSRLLDKLRGAQRARQQASLLHDALRKAHAEREATRQASEAIAPASEPGTLEDSGTADALPSARAQPRRREGRTAAIIALLVAAAALCAAVAWRGTADLELRSGLRMDPGLDLKRIPERSPASAEKPRE